MNTKKAYELLKEIKIDRKDIISLGYLGNLTVEGDNVEVVLSVPKELENEVFDLQDKIRDKLLSAGFKNVAIKTRLKEIKISPKSPFTKKKLQGVDKLIAVASGKGGVGKSTVAVNLAYALKHLGYSVGLFDADIYGPSISVMLGLEDERMKVSPDRNAFIPPEKFGVKTVSFGMLVDKATPILWRGAMFHKAYEELMVQTLWENVDFLVVDLPPGTGDAQLSLAQLFDVSGVIMVTTPQIVAISDVLRAIKGFEKLEVKILGIVENMSYFICPDSTKKFYIFGKGGGEKLSEITGIPLLASIPLDEYITTSGDNGIPVVVSHPDSSSSKAFISLAQKVVELLK